ncbi:DUF4340 domain-containing protein [Nitrosomonas sp. Nm166]|uniref:DUF4340 domain-containing protein n=1 Tax=Nitrosomonas sp. Nm166 TaxID=1881054 RepID=UPI0008EA4120|nr:DUF4340 domain-containing protein [Nitrosomonas sp. Nm166]SFE92608.1 protein of unknown function [Nitrosomonas sp. Nm166]
MTHHARLNLIMLATIIGLAVFLYVRPQSQDIQEYPISSGLIEAVQNLRIVGLQQEIVLKRLGNHWHLLAPVRARADEKKTKKILEILTAHSSQRFPLADLARFDLERPNAQLYVDDKYFGFGGFSPITNQQYIATNDYVYMISPHYALALPLNAADLINPQLLASDEIPVRLELNHLTVELQNQDWLVTMQHTNEALDEETIERWIQLWRTAHATKLVLKHELGSEFAETDRIKISLQDQQEIDLRILQNETEVIFLRANEGISYHFPLNVGQQLLDPYIIKISKIAPGA